MCVCGCQNLMILVKNAFKKREEEEETGGHDNISHGGLL